MKDAFCSHCGTKFDDVNYPKSCIECGQTTYNNPLPVVVCVQPVFHAREGTGLMAGRRAIEPALGEVALIAGHIEIGETVEEAAAREFAEETGLVIGNNLRITCSYNNGKGTLLTAVQADPIHWEDIKDIIVPCPENSELLVVHQMHDLCFPIHRRIFERWSMLTWAV
jgi:NADH pyrophosphatase NudC (nudix superfamily)